MGAGAGYRSSFRLGRGIGFARDLYMGDRWTTVKDRQKEIDRGLLDCRLVDLGIDMEDF